MKNSGAINAKVSETGDKALEGIVPKIKQSKTAKSSDNTLSVAVKEDPPLSILAGKSKAKKGKPALQNISELSSKPKSVQVPRNEPTGSKSCIRQEVDGKSPQKKNTKNGSSDKSAGVALMNMLKAERSGNAADPFHDS